MSTGSGSGTAGNSTANNFRGAVMMVISQAAFVCNDAIMKLVSADLSLFQTIFLRGLFTTLLLGLLVWYQGVKLSAVTKGDHRILGLRLVGEVGATLCYLTALFNMPIANSTAILQALPLAVTLGAALFLGEAVGWRRYSAILIGFCGVLIIVRPGAEGFNAYSFWALASVVFIVARDLATKRIASGIPSSLVALLTSIGLTITSGVLLPLSGWRPVELPSLFYLTGAGVFLVLGYLTVISAMRTGEISFVSPFRYTILIWAILLGLFVFGDVPDNWTLIGSFIVVATGIYTFYRERRLQQRDALELKRDVVAPEVLRHR